MAAGVSRAHTRRHTKAHGRPHGSPRNSRAGTGAGGTRRHTAAHGLTRYSACAETRGGGGGGGSTPPSQKAHNRHAGGVGQRHTAKARAETLSRAQVARRIRLMQTCRGKGCCTKRTSQKAGGLNAYETHFLSFRQKVESPDLMKRLSHLDALMSPRSPSV